jgi:ribonuclease G
MSKELVVSSTRHETRVALIEDDQVVEIYYQREKEYSLAGSIHKGRVTRVLPGMQSAFVDIGLDRDAFLYVSDFFEDNDEYDKVVSSVEDKVLKLEKGEAAPVLVSAPAPESAPATGEPVVEAIALVEPAAPAVNGPVAVSTPEPRTGERDSRSDPRNDNRGDRRGHRSRRRRNRGGRSGLPESKYFSPRTRPEGPPAEVADASESSEEEFPVLPGESLAKYGASEGAESIPAKSDEEPEAEPVETVEPAEAVAEEAEATTDPIAVVAEVPKPIAIVAEVPEPPEPQAAEDAPAAEEAPVEVMASEEVIEESAEAEAAAGEETGENGPESEASEGQPPLEEGVEPARIPTSLTAALREQGPRFLHRMSRRMRRKMRTGGPAPAEGQAPAPREIRAPEVRSEPRPEGGRAAARAEKSTPPSISDLLREGQEIIVQIAKEPLGQKGARITSHIALPGRFLVYMPTVDHVGISRKIPSEEERLRLKRVIQANRTGMPGGFIVRTAGDGRSEDELRADMLFLYNMWLDIRQKAEKRSAPLLIHHDLDVVERILRDQLTSSFKTVWVDNEEVYENVLGFVQRFQPALVTRIKLYTRKTPIFDEFNITSELEKALRPKVWLKSGGHIVINQTEALVAIDINTGKYVGKSNRLEDTIVKTNTDAVKEIVRQIRLRDLGGIIVVDFIDMDERKNRQKVMQALEDAMRADRAPYKILQFNDFGLVAITRKRVKQSLERTLCAPCPYCEGAGYVKSVSTVVGEILQEAHKVAGVLEGEVTLRVNPEVAKVLKSNKNDYLQEIEQVLGRTVLVKSDALMHQAKFDLT